MIAKCVLNVIYTTITVPFKMDIVYDYPKRSKMD